MPAQSQARPTGRAWRIGRRCEARSQRAPAAPSDHPNVIFRLCRQWYSLVWMEEQDEGAPTRPEVVQAYRLCSSGFFGEVIRCWATPAAEKNKAYARKTGSGFGLFVERSGLIPAESVRDVRQRMAVMTTGATNEGGERVPTNPERSAGGDFSVVAHAVATVGNGLKA